MVDILVLTTNYPVSIFKLTIFVTYCYVKDLEELEMIPSVIYSLIKFLQSLPVLVGIGVVAVTAVLAKILIDRKKKQITLEDPNTKYALKLVEKHNISHDTRKFVFALPSENHVLGLPVGEILTNIYEF